MLGRAAGEGRRKLIGGQKIDYSPLGHSPGGSHLCAGPGEAASVRTAAKSSLKLSKAAGVSPGKMGTPQPKRRLPESNLWRNYV